MRKLFVGWALVFFVVVDAASNNAIADQLFRCEQLHPFFCQNIHVGCAGRTSIPVYDFSITWQEQQVDVVFDDGRSWRADASEANGDTVFRFVESRNWIRIEQDGRFSNRMYLGESAFMSLGQCVRLDGTASKN